MLIALLAYVKRADVTITRTDWLFFALALSSLPFWYATSDPLWAVVILTIVDLLGFGPTARKVYRSPYSESMPFFALFAAQPRCYSGTGAPLTHDDTVSCGHGGVFAVDRIGRVLATCVGRVKQGTAIGNEIIGKRSMPWITRQNTPCHSTDNRVS